MRLKAYWTVFAVIGLALVMGPHVVYAKDDTHSRSTLLLLPGVYVMVEDMNPEVEKEGLTKEDLKSGTERQLEEAGIKVLSLEEWKQFGHPGLTIWPRIIKRTSPQGYLYNISVKLSQAVFLSRNPVIEAFGTTWSTSTLGTASQLGDVQVEVKKLVDLFIDAYFAMNPK